MADIIDMAATLDRRRAELGRSTCPYPWPGAADNTVTTCVSDGNCGCGAAKEISPNRDTTEIVFIRTAEKMDQRTTAEQIGINKSRHRAGPVAQKARQH